MASVNDLYKRWRDDGLWPAADEIQELAKTAWHPVSEPPTEADTLGVVPLVMVSGGDGADCWDYRSVQEIARTDDKWSRGLYWARIRDVVLLPPEE